MLHVTPERFDALVTEALDGLPPALGAQMRNPVNLLAFERRVERGHVRKIERVEGEAIAAARRQGRQPVMLQRYLVIVVEVVDADDHVAARQ